MTCSKRRNQSSQAQPILGRIFGRIGLLFMLAIPSASWAFDLDQLSGQLREHAVVRGAFIQEKHLRSLPQPLVSRGHYVLAPEYGLLWLLETPLQQDYRISREGIARRDGERWVAVAQQGASERQNRLSLALLSGDSAALQRDFQLDLQGTADDWQLTLTPRSALLRQIFTAIRLHGGLSVTLIELSEAQGDRTLLRLSENQPAEQLSDTERHDFDR